MVQLLIELQLKPDLKANKAPAPIGLFLRPGATDDMHFAYARCPGDNASNGPQQLVIDAVLIGGPYVNSCPVNRRELFTRAAGGFLMPQVNIAADVTFSELPDSPDLYVRTASAVINNCDQGSTYGVQVKPQMVIGNAVRVGVQSSHEEIVHLIRGTHAFLSHPRGGTLWLPCYCQLRKSDGACKYDEVWWTNRDT